MTTTNARTRGRPPELPQVGDQFIELVEKGVSLKVACAEVGVHFQTLMNWRHRGEDAKALVAAGHEVAERELSYLDFVDRLAAARCKLQSDLEQRLAELVPEMNAREMLEVLSRVDREVWGKNDTLHLQHGGGLQFSVVQRYGDAIAELLRGVLNDLALTEEQRARAPEIVDRHLARLEGEQPAQVGGGNAA